MYSDLPPRWKWAARLSTGAAWGMAFVGGLNGITDPPVTILSAQPAWMSVVWLVLVTVGGLGGMVGVLMGKNRLEEASAWFAGAGCIAYIITLWTLVLSGETTRSTQASMMTALFFFMLSRAITCGAHAYRVRKAVTGSISKV